ncbi:hypothetical protein LKL35_36795 [Streptomyces sp. ET3-23]|uniref:hypothetical protein n=1 Tax=Streptomyces sp. ET3-23 TaxID=2885643 RepID=UPI001D10FC19|nr:hypothetical protein [Streptomyces sp. ET3-23]MCC2280885.1 hypothetical protein [Streptomyces sp. ET3-23]
MAVDGLLGGEGSEVREDEAETVGLDEGALPAGVVAEGGYAVGVRMWVAEWITSARLGAQRPPGLAADAGTDPAFGDGHCAPWPIRPLGVERRAVQHELELTVLAGGGDDRAAGEEAGDGGLGVQAPVPEELNTGRTTGPSN